MDTRLYYALLSFFTGATIFCLGGFVGSTVERQRTVPVACEPSVVGLKRNGKEIPLTSAQRDSLSRVR